MLKQVMRDFVKSNKVFFCFYRMLGSLVVRTMGLFTPIKDDKIFFISFGGRRYDDSPKCIYEAIINDKRFEGYSFVWAFVNPASQGVIPGNPQIVSTDTPGYYRAILSSRFWITNTSVERGLSFKRLGNVCINTWHGSAIKRIGHDNLSGNDYAVPRENERFDMMCAQSEFDQRIFAGVYNIPRDHVPITGLPRNDSLLSYSKSEVETIRDKLGIPASKKVLLYTPTYREFNLGQGGEPVLDPPIHFGKWETKLGDKYVLLVRAHYVVTSGLSIGESCFAIDVSDYSPLNDLYAVADAMISDYSSTFIDYSILGRPMFCFAYDYDEYKEKRGFYQEILDDLPCAIDRTEDDLLEHILTQDFEASSAASMEFGKKYAAAAGNAAASVVDEIARRFL